MHLKTNTAVFVYLEIVIQTLYVYLMVKELYRFSKHLYSKSKSILCTGHLKGFSILCIKPILSCVSYKNCLTSPIKESKVASICSTSILP